MMTDPGEFTVIAGADGAAIKFSCDREFLQIVYTIPPERAAERTVFLALNSGSPQGSAVLPFARDWEGSTVFLPFPAEIFCGYRLAETALACWQRRWAGTQWSARTDLSTENVAATAQEFRLRWPREFAGEGRKLNLAIYSKELRQNDGWGEFFGSHERALRAGFGDQYLPTYLEITLPSALADTLIAPVVRICARLNSGQRARIYQLLVRTFGNTNETRKVNGTLAENGVGKFADLNDPALAALADLGFSHLWLTGVLRQATATDYSEAGAPADDPDLLKGLAGSPYAIRNYFDVCPDYALDPQKRLDEFRELLARIHAHGLKTIIDLVPNHVARSYQSHRAPEDDFGAGDDQTKFFDSQNNFFYLRATDPGGGPPLKLPTCRDGHAISPTCQVLAGQCDGAFDGERNFGRVTGNNVVSWAPNLHDWYETVKLNYGFDFTTGVRVYPHGAEANQAIPDTWKKMDRILEYWQARGVDGFRCDMAHLVPPEFWAWAIARARARQPEVFFMGEAYDNDPAKVLGGNPLLAALNDGRGNVMFDLLHAGFNAVYDDPAYKALKNIYDGGDWANDLDRVHGDEFIFQNGLRYAENHDEVRLAGKNQWANIGPEVGRAVTGILFGLGRGPVMLYHGQEVGEPADGSEGFGGDNARTSIFDYWSMPEFTKWVNGQRFDGGRLSEAQKSLRVFYGRLLHLIAEPAFARGMFFPLNPGNAHTANFGNVTGDPSSGHWMYAFLRYDLQSGQRFLVLANLHPHENFTNVRLRLVPEAIDFLELHRAARWIFAERLEKQFSLAQETLDLAENGFLIPRVAPLTPLYFAIDAASDSPAATTTERAANF